VRVECPDEGESDQGRTADLVIAYVLLAAALLALAVLVSRVVFRSDRRDDTERFNRAREVTTTWARQYESGTATPYPPEQVAQEESEDAARRR
jgi:hypothetical protein